MNEKEKEVMYKRIEELKNQGKYLLDAVNIVSYEFKVNSFQLGLWYKTYNERITK